MGTIPEAPKQVGSLELGRGLGSDANFDGRLQKGEFFKIARDKQAVKALKAAWVQRLQEASSLCAGAYAPTPACA